MSITRIATARVRLLLGSLLGVVVAAILAGSPALGASAREAAAVSGFDPYSASFVSSSTGWVLGSAPCASGGRCAALLETTDGGRHWSARALPAALAAAADRRVGGVPAELVEAPGAGLNVRFANTSDGWIYGGLASAASGATVKPVLWSTHDRGLTWRQDPVRGLGRQDTIFDLEASAGTAYLLESTTAYGTLAVKSSPVSTDSWHPSSAPPLGWPAGGGEQAGALVLAGSSGWLVEGNDRGTTGSARLEHGRWGAWRPPCAAVGHSFSIPVASTPNSLVASCVMGGFAYSLSKAAPRGAKLGSTWLYLSHDGGKTFTAGPELPAHIDGFAVLASPSPHSILASSSTASGHEQVLASFDGGLHWSAVYTDAQPNRTIDLAFPSPTRGVAVLRPYQGATSTMIMSFDGGHHWAPVSF